MPRREPESIPGPWRAAWRPAGGERDMAARIMAALARSSALLARSLDHDVTMLSTLEAVVPSLADWGVLQVTGEAGEAGACQVLHADEARRETLERLARFPFTRAFAVREAHGGPRGACHLVRAPDGLLSGPDVDPLAGALRELAPRRLAIVSLSAGRDACGTLALAVAESGRDFSAEDATLLAVLGEQFGIALHAARILRRAEGVRLQTEERLATLAHDLKNCLHSVSLALTLLSAPDLAPERRAAQVATVERAILQMNQRLAEACAGRGTG